VTAKLLSPNVLCVRGTAHDLSVEERASVICCHERLPECYLTLTANWQLLPP